MTALLGNVCTLPSDVYALELNQNDLAQMSAQKHQRATPYLKEVQMPDHPPMLDPVDFAPVTLRRTGEE
jgi:hypothetical protein